MPCDGVAVLKAELKKRDEEVQQILDILNEVQIPVVMESVMGDAVIRFSVSIPLPQGGFFPVRVAVTPGGQVTAITRTGTFCFGSLSMRIFASSTKLLLHICFWIICSLCLFIQRPKGFDPEGGTLLDKKAPLPPRSLFPFPLKKTKPSPSAPPTAGRYPQNLGTSSLETAAFVGIFHPC